MGCGYHPNHQPPPFTPTPHPKNRIISLFPNLYPNFKQSPVPAQNSTSQLYFPLLLDRYRDVVLAFSLYKLVSDRRIWTPIKPRFDEGIKELR